ncbi:MAG: DUF418 domain-containing protein [Psychrobium sp.]|nr:DUF418 domain-containing protein [Psychrobium sp.]
MDLSQRISSMDLLRGLAILGILFMNIVAFSAPDEAYMSPAWHAMATDSDKMVFSVQFMLAHSKFYSLFCLLFGAGMVMFWQRAEAKGFDAKKLTRSRMAWLLLFGALHLTFLFFGDILFIYAVCAFCIMGKVTWDGDKTVRRGMIYMTVGVLLLSLMAALTLIPMPKGQEMMLLPQSSDILAGKVAQATGSFGDMILYNLKTGGAMVAGLPIMFWLLGGIMLVGMGLMKNGFFSRGFSNGAELTLFAVGFTLTASQLAMMWQTDFVNLFSLFVPLNALGAVMLALAVASRLIKCCIKNPNFLMPLQYAGRMAFSLYILQSIIMTLLFKWIAPEMFGNTSRLDAMGIAAIVIALQLILATIWQTKIGQGPLEKMWRHLTYRSVKN